VYVFKLDIVIMHTEQEPKVTIQTAKEQITLYLRGLNFRKVTG